MKALDRFFIVSATIINLIQVQGIDDYTDSKRPYEFGFSIDGQQHRHEKKDKNGIIMGEFGFITADDVYHVTVYATDEKGGFRILSMKNIHLKATPAYREGKSPLLPFANPLVTMREPTPVQPLQPMAPTYFTQKGQNTFKPVSNEPPANSCSHCSVPTTPAPKSVILPNSQANINSYPGLLSSPVVSGVQNSPGAKRPLSNYPGQQKVFGNPSSSGPTSSKRPINSQNYPGQQAPTVSPSRNIPPYNSQSQSGISYPNQSGGPVRAVPEIEKYPPSRSQSLPQAPGATPSNNIAPYNTQGKNGLSYPIQTVRPTLGAPGAEIYPPPSSQIPAGLTSPPGPHSAKQFTGTPVRPMVFNQNNNPQDGQVVPVSKPTLVYAQMQIVDKNTDIHNKRPGEKTGLPEGLTRNDMMQLLYTFNYTLGFQAHYEQGYVNGFKQGYYYVTGRNGVRTRIDYTADDTGYHPKISQDVLDLLSDDVPKPETEKDAKYGLRGYEFKWLYYPIEYKSR